MEWKWGKRETVSGPHKCGLLKKMTAETGNYRLSLLNDGGWRRKDGNTILTGRRRQQLYLFSGVSKSLMITPMSFSLKKQLFDVTQTTSSHFLLFLKYIQLHFNCQGRINDDVKLVVPDMTCHQIEIRKFQVTI